MPKRICQKFTFHNVSINSGFHFPSICSNSLFTFHNVSINSDATTDTEDLHYSFTFHNVSINSQKLIRFIVPSRQFTFHNVSINSPKPRLISCFLTSFTFHNVSINSRYLIFLIFPTFSLLFLSILDSICVFPLYSHLKIIIYLLFMPLSMSPVFYFIEHRQFYNFIFLTAYAISFNFLNVYSYFSTYQQTHCNIIKLQLRIIFFILNRL